MSVSTTEAAMLNLCFLDLSLVNNLIKSKILIRSKACGAF